MNTYTPTAHETDELENMLADVAEIASERREKEAESHMFAMASRNAMPPVNADGWQMAADYALRTARILEQTADIAADLIRLRAEVATLRASEARMREALALASNRLHRCSVDYDTGTHEFIETGEWAAEARAALQGETK